MYGLLAAFALLQGPVSPAPAGGAPSIKLPAQVFVEPGKPFRITCETNCKTLRWKATGVDRLDETWINDPLRNFVGVAPQVPAQFRIEVIGSLNDQWAEGTTLVVVGQQPPGPIPPGPIPPTPNDPLFAELQLLFTADIDPNKSAAARSLASLYSTAGQAALKDQTVATTAQFLAKLRAASKILLPDDALPKIRDRLKVEFATCLGTADVPLTPELRTKASECLHRLALLLEALR